VRWFSSAALLAGLASVTSGCSILSGAIAISGTHDVFERRSEDWSPVGSERQVDVTVGLGTIEVGCQVFERTTYQVREVRAQWGTGWHVLALGLAGLEGMLAGAAYLSLDDPEAATARTAVPAALIADAAANVAIHFLMPERTWPEQHPDSGPWQKLEGVGADECPRDLRFEYAGRTLPVQPTGRLAAADEVWLIDQLVVAGGEVHIVAGNVLVGTRVSRETVQFSVADRCALARAANHPAGAQLCTPPPPPPPSAAPEPALTIRVRLGLPPR